MAAGSTPGKDLSIEQLAELREKTDAVSALLRKQLAEHLETLRLLFSPRWLLGKHTRAGARDDIPGADRSYDELKAIYARHYGRPVLLPKEIPEGPLSIDGRVDIYPWEYTIQAGAEGKTITMTSPVRWVANYRSGYSLSGLRRSVVSRETLRHDDAQEFVLNAIALRLLLEKNEALVRLLTDLRYAVTIEPCDGLGELPLVSIAAPLPSFKPDDDLILSATQFSGVPAFIELLDTDAVSGLQDPLRARIEAILGAHAH
jgi:hypothetical protein